MNNSVSLCICNVCICDWDVGDYIGMFILVYVSAAVCAREWQHYTHACLALTAKLKYVPYHASVLGKIITQCWLVWWTDNTVMFAYSTQAVNAVNMFEWRQVLIISACFSVGWVVCRGRVYVRLCLASLVSLPVADCVRAMMVVCKITEHY